jgi:ABC-type Fe3+/spermidine/putrescine transport system ATPase subunit
MKLFCVLWVHNLKGSEKSKRIGVVCTTISSRMQSLLELRDISKKYNQQSVLQQVSFNVNAGEIFGLLGESGSGKSTLLRIVAGLIDADEGGVWLSNQKLRLASDQLIPGHPDIKIVHQDYNLSAPLTVRENIAYALRYYEKAYRDVRVDELIQLCHLEAVATHTAKSLSGGEKQRTAIARALAEEAKVLLLDEPFAHLDLPNRRRLTETIRELAEQIGTACIFVTHDATDALSLSHQMGILREGQLLQIGTPEEVYQHPVNLYVAELTGEVSVLEKAFFEEHFGLSIISTNDPLIIRPEMLLIHETPKAVEAVVERSVFEGGRYRVYLLIAQQKLVAYHTTFLPKGKIVFVTCS